MAVEHLVVLEEHEGVSRTEDHARARLAVDAPDRVDLYVRR